MRLKSKPVEAVREVHVTFFLGKPQIRRLAVSENYIGGGEERRNGRGTLMGSVCKLALGDAEHFLVGLCTPAVRPFMRLFGLNVPPWTSRSARLAMSVAEFSTVSDIAMPAKCP